MGIEALDSASAMIAPTFKMSSQDWTDAFVPELLAYGVEIPGGLFLKGIGRTVLGVVGGLAALLAGGIVSGRDKKALIELAAHLLTHPNAPGLFGIVSTRGVTLESMTAELASLRAGVASGNLDLVRDAFAFSPADVDAYFRSVGAQMQALFAAGPAAAPAPAPAEVMAGLPEGVMAQVASAVGYGDVF